jgi:hypothetical protein
MGTPSSNSGSVRCSCHRDRSDRRTEDVHELSNRNHGVLAAPADKQVLLVFVQFRRRKVKKNILFRDLFDHFTR